MQSSGHRSLLIALLAIAAGAILTYLVWPKPEITNEPEPATSTPLPPLTSSPFLNTHVGVNYVGDAACADCHLDETRAYRQHPMGRSLFAAADVPPLERFDDKSNPFTSGRFHFQTVRRGKELLQQEWCEDSKGKIVARKEVPIAFAVGSGTQARSYLVNDGGFLFESPITWYQTKGAWGVSPGYEKTLHHFSRRVDSRCVYCHADQPRPVEYTLNKYEQPPFGQLAIGCERCHGPGELHIRERPGSLKPGEVDQTIVNPKRLAPGLRDNICEQCHLQGESIVVRRGRSQLDYRPGLPLHEYMTVFVRPPDVTDAGKIVTHFEQMHLSRCYQKSEGNFTCTSCHDPHRSPSADEKVGFYRQHCLKCHDNAGSPSATPQCSLRMKQRLDSGDNCLACHMPQTPSTNANHMAVTDHRVPRRPDKPPRPSSEPLNGNLPLVPFHRHLLKPEDEAFTRDLGIALVELSSLGDGPLRDYLGQKAVPLLEQATAYAPDDVPALEARGVALNAGKNPEAALRVLKLALDRAPNREASLAFAASIALADNRIDLAEEYAKRLVDLYPKEFEHHHRLAVISVRKQAWARAKTEAAEALRLEPFSGQARSVLIAIHIGLGDQTAAQQEFDNLAAIDPDRHKEMRSWFEEKMRR